MTTTASDCLLPPICSSYRPFLIWLETLIKVMVIPPPLISRGKWTNKVCFINPTKGPRDAGPEKMEQTLKTGARRRVTRLLINNNINMMSTKLPIHTFQSGIDDPTSGTSPTPEMDFLPLFLVMIVINGLRYTKADVSIYFIKGMRKHVLRGS